MKPSKFAVNMMAAVSIALLGACQSEASNGGQTDRPAEAAATAAAEGGADEARAVEDARAEIAQALDAAAATRGPGTPAMWRVADDDTTLYLFGTIHLLKPETEWRTAKFDKAFAEADMLVTEVDTGSPEGLAEIQALMVQRGVFADGRTLSGVLDDTQEEIVASALETVGIPMASMDPMQPWMAGLTLSLFQIQQSGYSTESGVETVLTEEAKASGKALGFLETATQQMDALAGGTLEEQIDGLVFASETLDMGPQMLGALVDEWADGDLAGLGAIMADPNSIGGENAYQRLLVDRNENWIPQIVAMLDDPGTRLIAVGAAHLAGPDSVVSMLRAEGLTVEPY